MNSRNRYISLIGADVRMSHAIGMMRHLEGHGDARRKYASAARITLLGVDCRLTEEVQRVRLGGSTS